MPEPVDDPLAETGQAIGGALRTGAMAAGQLVQLRFMRQAHQDRQSAADDRARAGALQERLRSEKTTAAAIYGPTGDPGWWERASTDDVVRAWDAAAAFEAADPAAAQAMADLNKGLANHPKLTDRVLADHPESLVAQTVAPLLAFIADPPAAAVEPDATPRAPDAPAGPVVTGPGAMPVAVAGEHAEASGVAGVVAPDFPAAGTSAVDPLLDSSAGTDPPGVATDVVAAGSEHQGAAAVAKLVGNDFPAGEALPAKGRGRMGVAPPGQPQPDRAPALSSSTAGVGR